MTPSNKEEWRSLLKTERNLLPLEQRKKASRELALQLLPLLAPYTHVLSFHSLPDEIDMHEVNTHLQNEGKLLLPKVAGDQLEVYQIRSMETELVQGAFGILEPNPTLCAQIEMTQIDCVLVPALGFDPALMRIGYGKGHYDRLLSLFRAQLHCPRLIGVGFKQQFISDSLPREAHDQPLDELLLI